MILFYYFISPSLKEIQMNSAYSTSYAYYAYAAWIIVVAVIAILETFLMAFVIRAPSIILWLVTGRWPHELARYQWKVTRRLYHSRNMFVVPRNLRAP